MTHTPGPWFVTDTNYVRSSGSGIVADASYLPRDSGNPVSEREANARLIAAAPDLKEIAKRYEAWEAKLIEEPKAWSGLAALPTLTQELWDELLEIQGLRNAAIVVAEGRS